MGVGPLFLTGTTWDLPLLETHEQCHPETWCGCSQPCPSSGHEGIRGHSSPGSGFSLLHTTCQDKILAIYKETTQQTPSIILFVHNDISLCTWYILALFNIEQPAYYIQIKERSNNVLLKVHCLACFLIGTFGSPK